MAQLQCMCVGLFLVVVIFSHGAAGRQPPPCHEANVDRTKNDCENGRDVVDAVFAKLDCLQVFNSCDHILMRRIAYVETEYGESENHVCDKKGGIWRLKRESYNKLFETDVKNMLRNASDIIQNRIGISFFEKKRYNILIKPFYSGLAARLYLHYLELTWGRVPFNGSIEEQAKFWVNNYTSTEDATEEYFINRARELDHNSCTINADVLFLVDTSGSIGNADFKKVRKFLLNFVKQLHIGPKDDQVGVVTFSETAKLNFPLNKHNTSTDLNTAIEGIEYRRGYTNLAEGLCHLIEGFREENGARPLSAMEVYRVAIILSDGIPNRDNPICRTNVTTYIEEADVLRDELQVRAYAIGVTNAVEDLVLKSISFDPNAPCEYYRHLDSFDELQDAHERFFYDICKKASIQAETNQTLNGTLDKNETIRLSFNISDSGITVKFCVSEGHIRVYGSVTISNPNSAFYNWMLEVEHDKETGETCLAYFFESNTTSGADSSSDPTIDYEAFTLRDQTLYVTVEGLEDHNRFNVNGTNGNTCNETKCVNDHEPPPPSPGSNIPVVVSAVMSGLVIVLLCIFIFFLVRGCHVHRRNKKKSEKEDEYSLLSENIDYVSFQ